MPITPEDVKNTRFSTVRFKEGYDEEEVDRFLDTVETELRRLLNENAGLRAAAARPQPVASEPAEMSAEQAGETALRTLMLAQRTADEAIAEARAEAVEIIDAARSRAGELEAEAQVQHAATVADLERSRASLSAEVAGLRTFEQDFRAKLTSYLQNQLSDLSARASAPEASTSNASPESPRTTLRPPSAPPATLVAPLVTPDRPPAEMHGEDSRDQPPTGPMSG